MMQKARTDPAYRCHLILTVLLGLAFVIFIITQLVAMGWAYAHPILVSDMPQFLGHSSATFNFPALAICNDLQVVNNQISNSAATQTVISGLQCSYNTEDLTTNPPTVTQYNLNIAPTSYIMTRGSGMNYTLYNCYNVTTWGAATQVQPFNSIQCGMNSTGVNGQAQIWIKFFANNTSPPFEYYMWTPIMPNMGSGVVIEQSIAGPFSWYQATAIPLAEIQNSQFDIYFSARFNFLASQSFTIFVGYNFFHMLGVLGGVAIVGYGLYLCLMVVGGRVCGFSAGSGTGAAGYDNI